MSWTLLLLLFSPNVIWGAEQVHLSLGSKPTEMIVTWVTQEKPTVSSVTFQATYPEGKEQTVTGHWQKFKAGKGHKIYVHRVMLHDLLPDTTYRYWIPGSGWSMKRYYFKTLTEDTDANLLVYGDLGTRDGVSLPNLIREVELGGVNAVFHVGDMAYDLPDDHGRNGDKFMRSIEPIASRIPYQVLPGNHESGSNFSHYNALFSMADSGSGASNNFYYSTNIGPMHIISITTEFYFYTEYGRKQIENQYNWLVNDLKEATKNRKERPWIVVMTHRPMYCSADRSSCRTEVHTVRDGIDGRFGLEHLLHQFNVDLYLAGHAHIYERSLPVYRERVTNSSDPYHNPKEMVHVTTGSAGCDEGLYKFQKAVPQWSAKRLAHFGYARVKAGRSRLHVQQVKDEGSVVVDEFEITKNY